MLPASAPMPCRRTHKLPVPLQRMLLAVGLRGAVAYGLGESSCLLKIKSLFIKPQRVDI